MLSLALNNPCCIVFVSCQKGSNTGFAVLVFGLDTKQQHRHTVAGEFSSSHRPWNMLVARRERTAASEDLENVSHICEKGRHPCLQLHGIYQQGCNAMG